MTIRVALLAAECEPWAKTGGLADVVDALARALGRLPEAGAGLQAPVDVFLPRYRSVTVPATAVTEPVLAIADPRGGSPLPVTIVDVAADGYRLRLVDVPAAFDRDGFYDHPDDPWRFTVFCRAALAALKRDGAPLDVLHVHDWHTGPALLERARGEAAGDPFFAGMAVTLTLHNLAYHGWTDIEDVDQLGLAAGDPLAGPNPDWRRPAADGHPPRRARQHRLAGVRRGGPDAGVRDGARRGAARARRPVLRHPQRHRPGGLGPGDRPRPGGAVRARRPRRQGRLPRGPARRAWASTRTTTGSCSG